MGDPQPTELGAAFLILLCWQFLETKGSRALLLAREPIRRDCCVSRWSHHLGFLLGWLPAEKHVTQLELAPAGFKSISNNRKRGDNEIDFFFFEKRCPLLQAGLRCSTGGPWTSDSHPHLLNDGDYITTIPNLRSAVLPINQELHT